jgi:hypothetical protein
MLRWVGGTQHSGPWVTQPSPCFVVVVVGHITAPPPDRPGCLESGAMAGLPAGHPASCGSVGSRLQGWFGMGVCGTREAVPGLLGLRLGF